MKMCHFRYWGTTVTNQILNQEEIKRSVVLMPIRNDTKHKDLQCFLSPRQNLLGVTAWWLHSPARCVLTEKYAHGDVEIHVHEHSWGG
jgi:hypothetical protein